MTTVADAARVAQPIHTRKGDDPLGDLAEALVPVAARLVATVHDEGPDAVAQALADAGGRLDALAVVLAAMVDPDARPSELLAWVTFTPDQRAERDRLVAAGVRARAADVIAQQLGAPPAERPRRTSEERRAAQDAANRRKVLCACGTSVQAGNIARHRSRSCRLAAAQAA